MSLRWRYPLFILTLTSVITLTISAALFLEFKKSNQSMHEASTDAVGAELTRATEKYGAILAHLITLDLANHITRDPKTNKNIYRSADIDRTVQTVDQKLNEKIVAGGSGSE